MKKLFFIMPMVFLLCIAFSCQKAEEVAEEPAVDIDAEEAAVRAALMSMSNALSELDLEGLISCWADDVIGVSGLRDKEASSERFKEIFSEGNIWNVKSVDKVVVSASGDLAYTIHSSESERIVEGETRVLTSTNINVWKKQADGSWKIVAFK